MSRKQCHSTALPIVVLVTTFLVTAHAVTAAEAGAAASDVPEYPELAPLPALDPPDPELVELGKMLFFDNRLSGDASLSCSTCHQPDRGWGDGEPLSLAYPGTRYFRNAKTLLNVAHARYFYWDGRLSGKDMPTQVRDAITETHFLNMDGRVMLERLKQVPEYVERFNKTLGGEPSFGRTLNAVAAFERTLVSRNVPFDDGALSKKARNGLELFKGKAECIRCHNGPYFSDAQAHRLGVPANDQILADPLRHLTLRSFAKFMGVPGFEYLREDPGFFTVSKEDEDWGTFVTPTLRELTQTAPYMHSGVFQTLEEVVDFYDQGGGTVSGLDPEVRPLGLSKSEKKSLIAFLESLSGDALIIAAPPLPDYEVIENWREVPN